MAAFFGPVRKLLRRLAQRDGGVIIMFALAAIPLIIAVGMAIDIGRAYAVKVRLGAALDDAGLAIASTQDPTISLPSRLNQYFYGNFVSTQIGTPTAVNFQTDPVQSNAYDVTGTATVPTTFMAILGYSSITVASSVQVTKRSPNIDFYLLLDSSPSMAIAATTSGINTMVSNTSKQGGCAFGCHQSNPTGGDVAGNPTDPKTGQTMDNYALARSLGVTLRMDLVRTAAQNLMTTAQSVQNANNAQYRMAIYTFDVAFNTIQGLTSNLTTAQTAAGNIQQLEVYTNNCLTKTNCNNDEDTNYDNAMTNINTTMPKPGNGTTVVGDTPQEVLFLVTDGVEDDCHTPTLNSYTGGGCRQQYLMNSNYDWCTAIKNRNIRIAVLYTEYLPLPTNQWYVNFNGAGKGISSFQPNIGTQLQTCASPGLYFMVTTDGDISGALSKLFEQAVETAYLSK